MTSTDNIIFAGDPLGFGGELYIDLKLKKALYIIGKKELHLQVYKLPIRLRVTRGLDTFESVITKKDIEEKVNQFKGVFSFFGAVALIPFLYNDYLITPGPPTITIELSGTKEKYPVLYIRVGGLLIHAMPLWDT